MPGEPLSLAHREFLEPLIGARRLEAADAPQATLSDLSLANLFLFRAAHGWHVRRGDWPSLTGRAYDGARVVVPLFALESAPLSALEGLLQGHDAFAPLSASQAARLDPTRLVLSHSRDDADYVYAADQFRHYRGSLLQKKGNLVRQLLASHVVDVQPYGEALADEARTVLDGWLRDKSQPAGGADDTPCREALAMASVLGLRGQLFLVDGRAAGFLLAEWLAPGVLVIRFAKALATFKGLYQHMFQHVCQADPDLHWLNFEQDLGLRNFRQTKLSYGPTALLTKFRARWVG